MSNFEIALYSTLKLHKNEGRFFDDKRVKKRYLCDINFVRFIAFAVLHWFHPF